MLWEVDYLWLWIHYAAKPLVLKNIVLLVFIANVLWSFSLSFAFLYHFIITLFVCFWLKEKIAILWYNAFFILKFIGTEEIAHLSQEWIRRLIPSLWPRIMYETYRRYLLLFFILLLYIVLLMISLFMTNDEIYAFSKNYVAPYCVSGYHSPFPHHQHLRVRLFAW